MVLVSNKNVEKKFVTSNKFKSKRSLPDKYMLESRDGDGTNRTQEEALLK